MVSWRRVSFPAKAGMMKRENCDLINWVAWLRGEGSPILAGWKHLMKRGPWLSRVMSYAQPTRIRLAHPGADVGAHWAQQQQQQQRWHFPHITYYFLYTYKSQPNCCLLNLDSCPSWPPVCRVSDQNKKKPIDSAALDSSPTAPLNSPTIPRRCYTTYHTRIHSDVVCL